MGEVEFEGPVTTRERSRCCRCLGGGGGGEELEMFWMGIGRVGKRERKM